MTKNNKEGVKYDGLPMEHEFDGIQELNNPAPPWLLWMFYITVVVSIGYWLYYHVSDYGELQEAEYLSEMAEADKEVKANAPKQLELVLLTDDESLTEGKELYATKACATCHGANGEGNAIGPNLTDNYWIHGGDIESVFTVIKNGIPTKGMTPFKGQLNDTKILKVSSYLVAKLKGSNPENPKDPQGELIE